MVLKEHVRKGKKLIAPLMSGGTLLQQTVWHVQRLPALFWLAFLTSRIGESTVSELVFRMTEAVQGTINASRAKQTMIRSYLMSEHLALTETEKQRIVTEHDQREWLVDVRPHRSEEHTSELQSHLNLVCRLLLEKK